LTVVRKVMLVESKGRCGFHLQQPIDLLQCGGMALGENFVDDRSNMFSMFGSQKIVHKGANSLDPVVESTMNEGSEVLLDHHIHTFNKNGMLRLEELMGWIGPFINRLSYELSGDDEWIVIGELSCLGPALDLSNQTANGDQFRSPHCHVHNLIHMDGTLVRTQLRFFRCEEGWRLVV